MVVEPGLVSWCWPWRLEAVGLPPHCVPSAVWLTSEFGRRVWSLRQRAEQAWRLCCGVHAPRPELWQTRCFEIGPTRNWPNSNKWCLLYFFFFCFFCPCSSFSSYSSFSVLFCFCFCPQKFLPSTLNPKQQTLRWTPPPSAGTPSAGPNSAGPLQPPTTTQHTQKKPEQKNSKNKQTINSQRPKSLHTTKTLTLAKVGLAKVGRVRMARVGLAKVGFDRAEGGSSGEALRRVGVRRVGGPKGRGPEGWGARSRRGFTRQPESPNVHI